MFQKILRLFKPDSSVNSTPSAKSEAPYRTLDEILQQSLKAEDLSKSEKNFTFTRENTDTSPTSSDSFAKHLLKCTFAHIDQPSDPHLERLVSEKLTKFKLKDWSQLDLEFRKLASQQITWHNKGFFLKKLKESESPYLATIFTMWPDGYVREEALKKLIAKSLPMQLIPMLLRINDWNNFVHLAAKQALTQNIQYLTPECLIQSLPALMRLKQCGRHLTQESFREICALYKNYIPLGLLLPQLHSPLARATAEFLWSSYPVQADILTELTSSSDPYIKFNTLREFVPKLKPEEQITLLTSLKKSKWTPAKLARLDLLRKTNYHKIQEEWISGLTDGSQSIRQHCRFYLKKESFPIENHYLEKLQSSEPPPKKHALFGLTEINSEYAQTHLSQWIESTDPTKLSTALVLIEADEANRREKLILSSLKSDNPSIRKSAYIAGHKLLDKSVLIPLVNDLSLSQRTHQYAAILSLNTEVWTSLLYSLQLTLHPDPSIKQRGQHYVVKNVAKFCNSFTRPSDSLKSNILRTLAETRHLLNSREVEEIESILSSSH